jgi:hypothetical protein
MMQLALHEAPKRVMAEIVVQDPEIVLGQKRQGNQQYSSIAGTTLVCTQCFNKLHTLGLHTKQI